MQIITKTILKRIYKPRKAWCHKGDFGRLLIIGGSKKYSGSPGFNALAGMYGADFLCYVTPKEHISLPDMKDVREGVIVTKIAAHIADIAKGIKTAKQQDRNMSEARTKLDWQEMANYVTDSKTFKKLVKSECKNNPEISQG